MSPRSSLLVTLLAAFPVVAAAWGGSTQPHVKLAPLFQSSDRCIGCHNGISTPAGEDVSIGFDWRPSIMANSSRDPYWQASVRRESMDHPESGKIIEDECAICHMPMARFVARQSGRPGEVFSHLPFDFSKPDDRLAADGVSCSLCHQIGKEKLGTRDSFVGGFSVERPGAEGGRTVYGPFKIEPGQVRIMRSSTGGFHPTEAEHIRKSELCATCHTLYTKALGPKGEVIGELPEQVPYQEWLHSEYRETQSCQACHMPAVKVDVPIAKVLGQPRKGVARHVFVGSNFLMQRIFNRYREELQVAALPQELTAAAERTVAHLKSESAEIAIERTAIRDGHLQADVAVRNLTGHKLPTAYPSRRVWLHVVVRDAANRTLFESGALDERGAIRNNDNDEDPARFEPHYTEISTGEQVQIYESIMAGAGGGVTTGLLTAVRYMKDNRLLPRGFDKRTAPEEIAVHGTAVADEDFTGSGDKVRYSIALGDAKGPFQVEAELWYQPISYRWAENLRAYKAKETGRFNAYYDSMSSASAVMLVRTSARTAAARP